MLQEYLDQHSLNEFKGVKAELSKQLDELKSRIDRLAAHMEYCYGQIAQIISSRESNEGQEDLSNSYVELETPQFEEINLYLIVELENEVVVIDLVEESHVEGICFSKGKTRGFGSKNRGPSLEFNPPPKKVKVHEGAPIYLGKDPKKSLRPSHKLSEKVNSKCSRVLRVKKTKSNRACLEWDKSGGEPNSKNKHLKLGWDPPSVPAY